ncbi:YCII-related protein [Sphingobium chlorophenolicum L-1]|uniref:YCII-related protein n=2 Tax=Sphingobium chlorophenolicum TaxID=46429 RepID=F6F292_SPHCR|nr:YCII-related protein [Sphingobium chlorophenolicum L-1]
MLYLRMCFDKPDMLALREEHRQAHRAYLASGVVKLLQAGPMMSDDDSHNIGSFMVVEADDLQTVKKFHDEDPFTKAGLFDEVRICHWDRHIG